MFSKLITAGLFAAAFVTFMPVSAPAAGSAPKPTICDRVCWSARASGCTTTMSTLNRAIVHHTATAGDWNTTSLTESKSKVRAHQNYHMDSNGWCDIGYHFLFDKLGHIFEGRRAAITSLYRGAHDGDNTNSFGFSMMGYFHTPYNNSPTAAILDSLYDCIAWRMPSGWGPYGYPNCTYGSQGVCVGYVDAHRRVKSTACPGDIVYNNYMGSNMSAGPIRNEINARINSTTLPTYTDDSPAVSANWTLGTSAADKYGADYRFRSTAPVSDRASWTISVGTSGSYRVQAWWSAGTNRSASAPYTLPSGAVVNVNQQANGGKWNVLGTNSLGVASYTTYLSCWTTTGYVVIADAVRYGP